MPSHSKPAGGGRFPLLLTALVVLASALAVQGASAADATAQTSASSAWDPPRLTNPVTIHLSDTNRTLTLSPFQDYVIDCPSGAVDLTGTVKVWGGHNILFQDCDGYVANPSGDWAGDFQNQTGTLWIHDVHFGGAHLTGGIQLQEPGATVVLRDVLFDQVNGSYATNHGECIQTWSGPARFLIDGLTCTTTYQGLFLLPNQYGGATPSDWDFRNIDVYGQGGYDYWLGNVGPLGDSALPDFHLENVYDCDPVNPRTWDGTSDANLAWSGVHGCPVPGATQFVAPASYGATGPDETLPSASDPGEVGDPLAYEHMIEAATATLYWPLSETARTTAVEQESADAGFYHGGTAPGVAGPLAGGSDAHALALQTWNAQVQTARAYPAPSQYTIEAWFRAQPGSGGGQIVGMNQYQNGWAWSDDHNVFLTPSGQLACYYFSAGAHELVSPGAYADGHWHLVQCAKGPGGMALDLDGHEVASNTFTGAPYPYSGYWLIGMRNAGDGPKVAIDGAIGQVAIYGYALSQAQDADHWAVGQGQSASGN